MKHTHYLPFIMLLFLSVSLFAQGNSQTHPFLIVTEDMYPELRQKFAGNREPFTSIKDAAFDMWDSNVTDADWGSFAETIHYNTLAYILEENTGLRAQYKNKLLSIIDRLPDQVQYLDNRVHRNYVFSSNVLFNSIIALDIIYNDLTNNQLLAAEADIAAMAEFYENNTAPWKLAHIGINLLHAIYRNDSNDIATWKNRYDNDLFGRQLGNDGSWQQSPGYIHARMLDTRMPKAHIINVMEFANIGSYYNDSRIQGIFEWATTFAFTPFGGFTKFGDTGHSTNILHRSSPLFYAEKYGSRAGSLAKWHTGSIQPSSSNHTNSFIYILKSINESTPIMPTSMLKEKSGAALWDKTDTKEALQGVLYSLKRDNPNVDEIGHDAEDVNSFDICAYGQHMIANAGVRYTRASGTGFNYPGFAPDGGRWFRARLQNTVLIGNRMSHSRRYGNGLVDGIVGNSIEFGTTDAGRALGNGSHERTLHFIHPIPGQSNGYFVVFDEIQPDVASESVKINFQTNALRGQTNTISNNKEYRAPATAFVNKDGSDGSERVNLFFPSQPTEVNVIESFKADFILGSLETDNVQATYQTESDGYVRATTVIFPEDATHRKPNFTEISGSGFKGVEISHNSNLVDTYIGASNGTDNTYNGTIEFKANSTFFRKLSSVTTAYTSTNGTSFLDTQNGTYGFLSSNPISVVMEDTSGNINAFANANVTFFKSNIHGVRIDGVLAAPLAVTGSSVQVAVPSGKHSVELVLDEPDYGTVIEGAIDSYVRDGEHSGTNYSNQNYLENKSQTNLGFQRQAFIRYDISNLSASVLHASARFTVRFKDKPGSIASLHLVNNNTWTDTSLTFDNKPNTNDFIASRSIPDAGQSIGFDITDEVNQAILNGQETINFRLSSDDSSGNDAYVTYHSLEASNTADRPRIGIIPMNNNNIDSYVRDGVHSGTNYANDNFLATKSQSSEGFNRFSYIRFDLSEFGNSVATANVRFTVRSRNIPGSRATLHLVNDNIWSDTSLNYDNMPGTNGYIISSSVPTSGGTVSFDVTDQVNQALSQGQQTINFRLGSAISNGNDAYVTYHSFEAANASDRPIINATGITQSINMDSYVRDGSHSGTNYSNQNFLETKSQTNSGFMRQAFIRFDISRFGNRVTRANVGFTVSIRDKEGSRAVLHLVNDNTWKDTSLTYGNMPGSNGYIISSSVPAAGGRVTFDVTDEVNQALSRGQRTINFRLGSAVGNGNDAYVRYHSLEATNASYRPQLTTNNGTSVKRSTLAKEKEPQQETTIVVAYPNPVSDVLHLTNLPNGASIEIYNTVGIMINSQKGNSDIDVSSLQTGVYFLRISIPGKEKQVISLIKR